MKRTMKKLVSLGLAAAMSLTMLVGCGSSNEATNATSVAGVRRPANGLLTKTCVASDFLL